MHSIAADRHRVIIAWKTLLPHSTDDEDSRGERDTFLRAYWELPLLVHVWRRLLYDVRDWWDYEVSMHGQ